MEATAEDVERLGELFDQNDNPKDRAMLRWRYLDNPAPGIWVDFAVADDGRTAGAYCVSPYRFRVGRTLTVGVQSLDTLVDADFRGQGLFTRLAKQTYGRCAADGVSLVYGFPNSSSAPGFFGKLGWTRLDPVPFLLRPLRPGYFARRALGDRAPGWLERVRLPLARPRLGRRAEIRASGGFDERHTRVWHDVAGAETVGIERDAEFLRWRYAAPFRGGYATHELVEDGELRGYVVSRVARKHGGTVGYVMELLHRGDASEGATLLRYALREMAEAGAEVVLAWSLRHAPGHGAYRRAGFFPLPAALRPIELHFGARAFDNSPTTPICNRERWYLSYADSDTV